MYLSIISGQAFNLSMFERSQNWNAKTEVFQTLGGGTEFQNARTSHRRIRFSSAGVTGMRCDRRDVRQAGGMIVGRGESREV